VTAGNRAAAATLPSISIGILLLGLKSLSLSRRPRLGHCGQGFLVHQLDCNGQIDA